MAERTVRALLVVVLLAALAAPVLASSAGPPINEQDGKPTAQYGCTCHGGGAPSDAVLISIAGIPESYTVGTDYTFTITIAADGAASAGFLLSSGGAGTWSWAADAHIRPVDGGGDPADAVTTTTDITQSEPVAEGVWTVTWSSPASDVGAIDFSLVGNAVDGSGAPDAGDLWNILTFTIAEPAVGSAQEGEALTERVISMGDHEALFAVEDHGPSKAELEAVTSDEVFELGNLFYFGSLILLIIGAVAYREIDERKRSVHVPWLAKELAMPQAVRRGVLAVGLFAGGVWSVLEDQDLWMIALLFFCSAWAGYGVYRTWLQTRQEQGTAEVA